jgi:hypothetical protein
MCLYKFISINTCLILHLHHSYPPNLKMAITITSLTMTRYFSGTIEAITKCKEVLSLKALNAIGCSVFEQFMNVMERVLFATFTCILALGTLHFVSLLLVYIICFCYIILYMSLFRHVK